MECINSESTVSQLSVIHCDNGTSVTTSPDISHSINVTVNCSSPECAIIQNIGTGCSPNPIMCSVECTGENLDGFLCMPGLESTCSSSPSESTVTAMLSTKEESPHKPEKPEVNYMPMQTTTTHTSNNVMLTSTEQANATKTPSSSDIIPILLGIIIGLMALFICIMVATMIIRKLRKRKHRYTINSSRDLIHQDNIYQMGDGNRRPSRIIPIDTKGGECLKITEFPRYNDIDNHHKLSNASLSMSYEKGGFPTNQMVSMATPSNPNGGYPQEHFYSIIPENKFGHSGHQPESHFPVQHDHHHPQVHAPQIHVTHSSQPSVNGDIDPYSTLDEARNEALLEISSTHTRDEQSDDTLMLNMFGSDKPKWTHDMRPLRLNVPPGRKVSGRVSMGDEDEYITMTGSDLEGGWGEVRSRANRSGFDTIDIIQQGHESGFDSSDKVQSNRPMQVVNHPSQLQELSEENEMETDEAPPTPDKSIEIEDLYAKVRKKSKKSDEYSENSDGEVTFIVDDNENPSQTEYLIPPNPEYSGDAKKDQALCKGQQKHKVVAPGLPSSSEENSSTSQGERHVHIEVQAGKTAKQATGGTQTL